MSGKTLGFRSKKYINPKISALKNSKYFIYKFATILNAKYFTAMRCEIYFDRFAQWDPRSLSPLLPLYPILSQRFIIIGSRSLATLSERLRSFRSLCAAGSCAYFSSFILNVWLSALFECFFLLYWTSATGSMQLSGYLKYDDFFKYKECVWFAAWSCEALY